MTIYLVAWLTVSFKCPLLLPAPDVLKPYLCDKQTRVETLVTSYRYEAERKVKDLGPGAVLEFLKIERARPSKIEALWTQKLDFK